MSWHGWQAGNGWATSHDGWDSSSHDWHSDSWPQEVETGGNAGRVAKKAWDLCVQLGGTARASMTLDDRLRLIHHMIPSLRRMKLLTLNSEQADAVIYIASGQQPDLKVKTVAKTMDSLMEVFKEEYHLRIGADASGLPEMIDSETFRLVPFAKDMLFTPFDTIAPASEYYPSMHSMHLLLGWAVCNCRQCDHICCVWLGLRSHWQAAYD